MYLIPERELYTVLQLFYCARYSELAKTDLVHELDFNDATYQFEAVNYQTRSKLLLGQYKEARAELAKNREGLVAAESEDDSAFLESELDALLNYANFLEKPEDESAAEFFGQDGLSGGLTSLLAACYYAKKQDFETALAKLQPEEDLENVSFGTYLLLLLERSKEASNYLLEHVSNASVTDTIGYNTTQSWVDLGNYGEDLKRGYYNYDELSSSSNTESVKCLVSLLVAHIKLLQFPEAQEVLQRIEKFKQEEGNDDFANWEADLLVNQIALASINADSVAAAKLQAQLEKQAPNCEYLQDIKEKNELFDAVVAKYN